MAIINSLAIGKARNSAGNITFSTVKGRTIAREKPAYVRNPDTKKQRAQRSKMRAVVAAWRTLGSRCKFLFTSLSGYGSEYNEFVKRNIGLDLTRVYDEEKGTVLPVEKMQLGQGRYDANALKAESPEAGKIDVTVSNIQLLQELKVGDEIGVILASTTSGDLQILKKEITKEMYDNGFDNLKVTFEAATYDFNLHCPFFYSSARNESSTVILKTEK